jgi:hypothetical protein
MAERAEQHASQPNFSKLGQAKRAAQPITLSASEQLVGARWWAQLLRLALGYFGVQCVVWGPRWVFDLYDV